MYQGGDLIRIFKVSFYPDLEDPCLEIILRAFFFGTVLYAFIWSKRNFSILLALEKALIDILLF